MENNKYFTPDISDIRIGYQFEVRTPSKEWLKETFTYKEKMYFSSFITDIDAGNLRVPYLTKEQIEAEGWYSWNGAGDFNYTKPKLFLSKKENTPFKNRNYTLINLIYDIDSHLLIIDREQSVIYKGNCLSINEFRIITKLLNLN